MKLLKASFLLLLGSSTLMAQSNSLQQADQVQQQINISAQKSQQVIDKSSELAFQLQAEIEQLQEANKNLQLYRDHLAGLVANQQQEKASLEKQLSEIEHTRQGVVPLMYHMLNGLQLTIEQDLPIKAEQRLTRLKKLQTAMLQADVSDAEKYRRILEAYQIEVDYGNKLGFYQAQINVDLVDRRVDLMFLGRLSLVARSLDGENYWAWNQQQKVWLRIDKKQATNIDHAFAVANKQQTPSLLTLPISVTKQETIQ
ncbi:MAG: DUF3450 domain-containing protein [Alteromonadales bacterium]|nr:DUF3450 domain-containing protein [Alteromonadales bacterium]